MPKSVELLGVSELSDKLLKLGKEIGEASPALRRAARESFEPVAEEAKRRAAVNPNTGNPDPDLRDSIRLAASVPKAGSVTVSAGLKIGKRKVPDEVEVVGGGTLTVKRFVNAAWRWHFREFGTRGGKEPPAPFIRPAMLKNVSNVQQRLSSALRRQIERVARKRKRLGI